MISKTACTFVVAVMGLGLLATPSHAVNMLDNYLQWVLTPDSTQRHPKKHTLAFLVTESFPLTACEISYSLDRDAAGSAPVPEVRGKMRATLKIIKRNGTVKVGTKRMAIAESWEYGNGAFLMWADSSGADWYDESVNTDLLPLDVEPGDVIQWTVRFSGVGDLEVESNTPAQFRDVISLRAGFYNCGTHDHPCF